MAAPEVDREERTGACVTMARQILSGSHNASGVAMSTAET